MKTQQLVIALIVLNLVLVTLAALVLMQARPVIIEPDGPVLRAEAIELVDGQGRVRAQINVEESGEAVLRMRDSNGTIRIKIGASQDGSGLLLLNASTEPGVHILSNSEGSSITLTGSDGQQQIIQP
jgi:hypothetical protein